MLPLMMMSPALSLLLAAACGGGVEVRVAADRTVDLESKGASIAEVLGCMSERVGFKVVVEPGVALNQRVTLSLTRQTEPQLIFAVLDGLRLNYAHSADRTGARVVTLHILGQADRSASKSAVGPAGRSQPQPAAALTEPEPQHYEGEPPNDRPAPGAMRGSVPGYPPSASPASPSPGTPLYPEPRPLSPLTLRDSRRLPSTTALAQPLISQPPVPRSVPGATR